MITDGASDKSKNSGKVRIMDVIQPGLLSGKFLKQRIPSWVTLQDGGANL